MTTTMIDQWQERGEALLQRPVPGDAVWCVAAATLAMRNGANWRANSVAAFDIVMQCDDVVKTLRVHPDRWGQVNVTQADMRYVVRIITIEHGELRFEIDGVTRHAVAVMHQRELHMAMDGNAFVFIEVSPFPDKSAAQDATQARAPVAGKVTQLQVAVGDQVKEGQALLCVEAMKMEIWLTAQAPGMVVALHATLGEQVISGAVLVEIEIAREGAKET